MAISERSSNLGRQVFGAASLAFGLITLAWHNYKDWDQLRYILNAADGPVFLYAVAAAQIFGGGALQFRRTAKVGALVLGAVYLVFALLCVPPIVATPQTYDRWGNFFEQFSLVTGAALIYAYLSSVWAPETLNPDRSHFFGHLCQFHSPSNRRSIFTPPLILVPKWLPPRQKFWAIATTVLFALAAVALLTNRMALLAARLLTIMTVAFGLLV